MESVEFLFLNRQKSYIKIQGLINIFLDKCNAKAGYITPPSKKKINKNKKIKNHRSSSLAHFQTELSSIHTLILMFGPQAQKRPEMKS